MTAHDRSADWRGPRTTDRRMSERSLLSTVPMPILASAKHLRVSELGMSTGPSFAVQRREAFEPPIQLVEALQQLERYRSAMRIGRVVLEDGRTWFFDRDGYRSETAAPPPGGSDTGTPRA